MSKYLLHARRAMVPVMLLLFVAPLVADDTPTSLRGAVLVDAAKAAALMNNGAKVIDVRIITEFIDSHIKGAVSIPYRETSPRSIDFDASADSFNLARLPANKLAPIVVYCNGPACWKSYKAAVTIIKAGYKQVYWFRGGFPEWKASGLPVE
ncbi:MAG: rhodanese-like domain-containing protein [Terracidiphilus sp.]